MKKYRQLELYEHNEDAYKKMIKSLETGDVVGIVHATGTGKAYISLQLAYDNKEKNIMYLCPGNGIIEHMHEIISENKNVTEQDFKHVDFRTYASLINLSKEEIKKLDIDILIVDEFHHIGAPVWGKVVEMIVETHPNIKVVGTTAYTVRERGTSYERDIAEENGEELFSDKIVSRYDLCDAMIDKVLPKPIYKSARTHLLKTEQDLEKLLKKATIDGKAKKELEKLLKDVKKKIQKAPSTKEVVKKNIKKDGKYIYYCPVGPEEGINDIDTIIATVKTWLKEMNLTEEDYVLYKTTSQMKEEGKKNRKCFYNDKDLNGKRAKHKLRIMFAINQYNEGIHAPNIDGVILGRKTNSDIVFFEQIGRALAVRGKTKEEYESLTKKSKEELLQLAKEKEIEIKETDEKEEIIEKLIAPIIIDLTGNIEFIKELETNLTGRIKEIQEKGPGTKRKIKLKDASFDIDILNEDLYQILKYVMDRLTMTWEDKYALAKAYYEHYKNLDIPRDFKTINGYERDDNGVNLYKWTSQQRVFYKQGRLSQERIKLLEEIKIKWNLFETEWIKKYELAKAYYEHYKNLDIPRDFKTKNGYERDKEGENLGQWISSQRFSYQKGKLSKERIKLLEEIKINWNLLETEWIKKYELAKAYYEHYKNLDIPRDFKTKNGYERNKGGKNLGKWLQRQRDFYKQGKLSEERIKLLEEIKINWNPFDTQWAKNYELAKAYYEYYKNLDISRDFKTTNGYEYDAEGENLGMWISKQRVFYKEGRLSQERIKLLEEIKINWNPFEKSWKEYYELAKAYYDHHKNLDIPKNFKTINGYERDKGGKNLSHWLSNQRVSYRAGKLSQERIKLLEEIKINWNMDKIKITEKNTDSLRKIVLSYLEEVLDEIKTIESMEDIEKLNNTFLNHLEEKTKRR